MIRYTILIAFVVALTVVAARHWFYGLCMILILTTFSQRPDMPKELLGIPGLNPWNLAFLIVLVCWLVNRHRDPVRSPPSHATLVLYLLYVLVVAASGVAGTLDAESARGREFDTIGMFIDGLVNPLKYVALGLLFFEGALTRKRVQIALFAIVGSDLMYGLMMFKSMGPRVFTIDYIDARRLTDKLLGLYANDLAQVLAFAIWAAFLLAFLMKKGWLKVAWIAAMAAVVGPFLVLKSRAGYFGLLAGGLVVGVLRYRIILLILPVACLVAWFSMASLRERFLLTDEPDEEITAGRMTELWPPVIRQIPKSPIWGYGRYGILRSGAYDEMVDAGVGVPLHPHNAYLEMLLDTGVLGMGVVLAGFIGLTRTSYVLSQLKDDPLLSTAGLISLTAIATLMTVGLSGASFYPFQSALPYISLWGVTTRLYTELASARQQQPLAVSQQPPALAAGERVVS